MQVVLEISNSNDLQLLLQYVRLLSSARVVASHPEGDIQPSKTSFFRQYYGSIRSEQSDAGMDAQIKKLREAWERDTW